MSVFQDVKAGGSASHKSIDETMAWNSAASENAAGCFYCRIEVRDDLVFVVYYLHTEGSFYAAHAVMNLRPDFNNKPVRSI